MVTVQFGVRVTADCTAPVTVRGQRLSREHLFTLYQTVGKDGPTANTQRERGSEKERAEGLQGQLTIERLRVRRRKIQKIPRLHSPL